MKKKKVFGGLSVTDFLARSAAVGRVRVHRKKNTAVAWVRSGSFWNWQGRWIGGQGKDLEIWTHGRQFARGWVWISNVFDGEGTRKKKGERRELVRGRMRKRNNPPSWIVENVEKEKEKWKKNKSGSKDDNSRQLSSRMPTLDWTRPLLSSSYSYSLWSSRGETLKLV